MPTQTETARRTRALLAANLVAALLFSVFALAACGGDDGEPEPTPPPTGEEPTDQAGRQVFVDAGCGSCHTLAAAGTDATVGPNLDETAAGDSAEEIRASIVDPDAQITEGFSAGVMPQDFGDQLSGEELDALSTFIAENAGR